MIQAKNLEKVFNLPSSEIIEGEYTIESKDITIVQEQLPIVPQSTKFEDSDYIRKNLKDLADNTKLALDLALQIQAENPNSRNTEAVAKMADSVTRTLSSLIQLNKSEKDEEFRTRELDKPESPKTVNQTLIMTTENLIKEILSQTKQLKDK